MRVRWSATALRDLEAIGDFIARDKPAAADATITKIFSAADTLAQQPHLGRAGRVAGTRELVIAGTPFIAPYRVLADEIQIIAVFHAARRWPSDFD